MRSRALSRAGLVVAACTAALLGATLAAPRPGLAEPAPAPLGQTYYVDCTRGHDSASGLSASTAWRSLAKVSSMTFAPGDAILFRRGTRCLGTLAPGGSGSPGAPIVVAAYGRGAKPRLDGQGARATVFLHNVQQWELHDLDVANLGPVPQPGQERNAVWVVLDGLGTGHHYVMDGLDVHGVNSSTLPPPGSSDPENWNKDSGAIVFNATGGNGFDDVLIQRNTLRGVNREGIMVGGGSPTTRLVVRGNRLRDIGGDGIVAVTSVGALVEHNVVDGFDTAGTSFNAGIWAFDSTDAVFQYNDVSHGRHSPLDSMAYDIDGGNHHLVFQYNLSHDNSGGFLMLCNNVGALSAGADNGGSVVRYNISQDDRAAGRGVIDAPFLCSWEKDISIYNNTVFTRDPRVMSLVENTGGSTMHLYNNILVGPSPAALIYDQSGTWQNNLYMGVTCVSRPPDPNGLVADPRFVAPGTARSLSTASGYRLRVGSPALNSGVAIPGNGGRDYFGNPVPANTSPNIGAYQGPGVAAPAPLLNLYAAAVAPLC